MTRLWADFCYGYLSAGPYTASATSLTSTQFATLPVVAAPNTLTIVLDPYGATGAQEKATVTAHASGSTTVTVVRGSDGTQTGLGTRALNQSTNIDAWSHGATSVDMESFSQSPTSTLTLPHTWAVSGLVQVTSAGTGYLPPLVLPVISGETIGLLGVYTSCRSGTCNIALEANSAAVAGLSSINVSTTQIYTSATSPPVNYTAVTALQPVINSIANTPDGLSVTAIVAYTVAA